MKVKWKERSVSWHEEKRLIIRKKGHPGPLPKNNRTEDKSKEAIGDEELIVTQEAFKNRVQTKDFG